MDANTIVWVRAGGRCVICKRYLLDDNHGHVKAIGEVAHIVGRTDGPKSPRGSEPLPLTDRDRPENLLLLCRDDHALADTKRLESRYTVAVLTRLKEDHEREVRRRTDLLDDRATAVLRVLGDVRGNVTQIARTHVDLALADADRFPRYLPTAYHHDAEVDLSAVPETTGGYWHVAAAAIDRGVTTLEAAVRAGAHPHASVFAIARLPLLVHLGSRLDDTYPVDVYQLHRSTSGWAWPSTTGTAAFVHTGPTAPTDATGAVVVVNASGTIHPHELPASVDGLPQFGLVPAGGDVAHDIIASRDDLTAFDTAFRGLLSRLETQAKRATDVHLFAAAPVSAAVTIGRAIDPQVHPRVHVYDRSPDGYRHVLTLGTEPLDVRNAS